MNAYNISDAHEQFQGEYEALEKFGVDFKLHNEEILLLSDQQYDDFARACGAFQCLLSLVVLE